MPGLYDITTPVFTRALRNPDHLLEEASSSRVTSAYAIGKMDVLAGGRA